VKDPLEEFTNRPFSAVGRYTSLFQMAGIRGFAGAARHVRALSYGRIADRQKLWLVLEEGRGSCTTKHALLAELAREQGIDVHLTLGMYEMNERNTPGVVRVLSAYRLEYIPEAHYNGGRIDGTGLPAAAEPIDHFLQEEPITVDQIGAYRHDVHQRYLHSWIARTDFVRGRNLEEIWCIRAACIAALAAADCPAR